jgi:transposase
METNKQFFIGIDVSKLTLDACLMVVINHKKQSSLTRQFDNNPKGLKTFGRWLQQNNVTMNHNSLVVIENTGIYQRHLWSFCSKINLPIHIGNAAQIKWSLGIVRGKSDCIDSVRLCDYAFKNHDNLKPTPVLNPVLIEIKDLMTARSMLVRQLAALKKYLNELKNIKDIPAMKLLLKDTQSAIEGMEKSIKSIESTILKLIMSNKDIKEKYELITSVPGVGFITSLYFICCTNNFSNKISGKQLACYAGVVPFEYTSGTSIKGRNRVHQMANKELKKLLHLSALSAIKNHAEFKDYYTRKKLENKNGMSVINAIRNKIVLRVASVVNNGIPYVNKYVNVA